MAAKGKMVRVAPGIYKRNGVYIVAVWNPLKNGKGGKDWFGGIPSLTEAKRIKHEEELRKKSRGAGAEETCDSFAERWPRDFPRREPSTNQHNAERVAVFARDFKGVRMRDISPGTAYTWVMGGTLPDGREVPPHRSHLAACRAMFSDAVKVEIVARNPFVKLGIPQSRGRSDLVVPPPDELQRQLARLVAAAAEVHGDYGEHVFGPMIDAAAWTGMRPGELYALTWADIDFQARKITVDKAWRTKTQELAKPKNGVERVVTLLPGAERAFRKVARRAPDQTIFFIKRNQHRFTGRVHHYYWNPVRIAAGYPKMEFYELRHYFGTMLAERRASPYDIAGEMGHVDGGKLAMKRYIHVSEEARRARVLQAFEDDDRDTG